MIMINDIKSLITNKNNVQLNERKDTGETALQRFHSRPVVVTQTCHLFIIMLAESLLAIQWSTALLFCEFSPKCVEVSSTQKLLGHTFPMTCSAECLLALQLPVDILLEWAKLSGLRGRKPLRYSLPSWISCTRRRKGHECKFWWNNVFWKTRQFQAFSNLRSGRKCSQFFAALKVFLWLDFFF